MSNFDQQREQILLQQQATPKLHLMVPTVQDMDASMAFASQHPINESSTGAFWDDINNTTMGALKGNNDTSQQLLHQSIIDDYGSAQEITDQIKNKIYTTSVKQHLTKAVVPAPDYSINGEVALNASIVGGAGVDQSIASSQVSSMPSQQMIYPGQKHNSGHGHQTDDIEWIPDEQAENCYICKKEFNFFFRRHHCNFCRKIFCKNCSNQIVMEIEGEKKKIRSCKKCQDQHSKYTDMLTQNQSLLSDQISPKQRRAQSYHFSGILSEEKPMTPMNIINMEDQSLDYSKISFDDSNIIDANLSIANDPVARMSATNKRAMANFLNTTENVGGEGGLLQGGGGSSGDADGMGSNRVTERRTNEWLNYKLRCHLDNMIDQVIQDYKIDQYKWRKILANCTKHAVMTIRPSSRMLADSIDFNSFIKIVTVQHANQEKCQYVNGVVFKKDVASRRMRTQIEMPKVLVINSNLGYVQDDDGPVDMQAEINQQKSLMKIIMQKIKALKPNLIFIEKDASRTALEHFISDDITVVTVTSPKMLKMIARSTQTIVCPSINQLSKRLAVGQCLNFRVEQIKPLTQSSQKQTHQSLSGMTSLMFLEGCQAKLGCSIVLSGPDQAELKQVRHALKACLKTARILLLEREMFRYFMPEISMFQVQNQQQESEAAAAQEESNTDFFFQSDTKPVQMTGPRSQERTISEAIQRSSLVGNVFADSGNFEDVLSPFLFDKHMNRGQMVFEHFSLVLKNKNDQNDTSNKFETSFIDQNANRNSTEDNFDLDTEPMSATNKKNINQNKKQNEAELRKKLKNMCSRPKRTIIPFLAEEKDMSLFTFLRKTAKNFTNKTLCNNEGCKKLLMEHTDYWYHGDGCVQIKKVGVQSEGSESLKSARMYDTPVYIHCFCQECKREVMTKDRVPHQVLEMSFFKLLEQFFYNQNISVSQARAGSGYMGASPMCQHSLFRDCELIFQFSPVEISIKFERLEAYTLDMFHFGLEKGAVSEDQHLARIVEKLGELRTNVTETFNFIFGKIEVLLGFMEFAMEEVKRMSGQAVLDGIVTQIVDFLTRFKTNGQDFVVFVFQEVFGEQVNPNNIQQFDHLEGITEEVKSHGRLRGKSAEIKSLMQFNRLHKILSARACEYLFILRNSYLLIKNDLLNIAFPKKSPFSDIDTQIQAQNAEKFTKNEIDKQMNALLGHSVDPTPSGSFLGQRISSVEGAIPSLSFTGSSREATGISSNAKTYYKELAMFELQLQQNRHIADLVEQCVFIPTGFNKNAIDLVKFEGTGNKKSMDLSAIIASALSSNMYLNGLMHLEYLNMQAYTKPFNGQFINQAEHDQQNSALDSEIVMAAASEYDHNELSSKVQLSRDVLNEKVPMAAMEQELLSNSSNAFKISFSTVQPHANLEVLVDDIKKKQFYHGYDVQEFYSACEQIADLDSIEVPLTQKIFDELIQLFQTISVNLSNTTGRTLSAKKRKTSLDEQAISHLITAPTRRASKVQDMLPGNNRRIPSVKDYNKILTHENAYRDIYHIFHERMDYFVKVYCPKQFEALRKLYCGSYNDFLQATFRSDIWKDNSGGKSNSSFFKSFDNKFILKAVEQKEIKMFNEMSSSYFEYLSRSFTQQCPTAIAKTLGMFRITIKRGKSTEHFFVQLSESILINCDDSVCIKYDLKGSRRNRYIPGAKQGQVTLDNNFLHDRKSRPIPMQYSMKRLLKIAIANDSLYLTKHSIIDYSMLVIINPEKKTVRIGIIDYIQQYTLEKELESYLKQTISNEDPTIIPPDQYKQRFRTAMDKYFIAMVPDQEEKLNRMLVDNFDAHKIHWSTKESSDNTLSARLGRHIVNKLFNGNFL